MHDLPLLTTVAVGFAAAWLLGMLTHRLGLSPIVGYLLAGVLIGPYTPGYVGDAHAASQLAEIGVILLMFGVGLHFHFHDLLAVRKIAVPGAIGQSVLATGAGVAAFGLFGWPISTGLVIGIAMSVASTVVLMRVLMDAGKLDTPEGHAAVGWLIVEDIITVIVLVLIPALAGGTVAHGTGTTPPAAPNASGAMSWLPSLGWAFAKLAALVALVFFAGSRIVPGILVWVARQRSRELFTLTVLVLSVAVATGAAMLFGASVALGAFLAGMVVGQSPVSRQAGADLLPLRDAFAVLFFVAVGMLFDPSFLITHPAMVLAGLAIVLLVKPLAAIAIVALLGYPARTALTVAIGLAQIGEFSFIVANLARQLGVMPDEGSNVLVACAIVSITLNPVLFRSIDRWERMLENVPFLWNIINRRANSRTKTANAEAPPPALTPDGPLAVIVGYGPAGQHVDRLLQEAKMATLVVDLNMDAIKDLRAQGRPAFYGDATQSEILDQAGVARATHLILTMPDAAARLEIIAAGRDLNPALRIFARARYAKDQAVLQQFGNIPAAVDEIESAVALARLVLLDIGAGKSQIKTEIKRIRRDFEDTTPSAKPAPESRASASGPPS